jgi:arsenate reductase
MIDGVSDSFAALGHPSRLAIFRMLARRAPHGVRAGEIAEALGILPNTLTAHLAVLTRARLIGRRRIGTLVRYSLDMGGVGNLVEYLVLDCCRGRPELCAPIAAGAPAGFARPETDGMTEKPRFNVLFVCTGNSARSILAEAIMNHEAGDRFRAYSAGTRPRGAIHPLAYARLRSYRYDTSGLRSKSLLEFDGPGAPRMDFVFTVCDQAANEECPTWPGRPFTGHWGIPDPAAVEGPEAERALAFAEAFRALRNRITAFVSLPLESLDALAIQVGIDEISLTHAAPR